MDKQSIEIGIKKHFSKVKDPRINRTRRHNLIDIIVIAVCAIICGADGWESMETYGKAKYLWLKTYLELPNGIPGHDTIRRVFERIDPESFNDCFLGWVSSLFEATDGRIIPIDGKTVRGSHDREHGKSAIHMVSAWSMENQLVLGQLKTEEKSNEITAIPLLLDLIDVRGSVVTIDAMGCQKTIARKIIDKNAHYVLGLKENQKSLLEDVVPYFENLPPQKKEGYDVEKSIEKGHGRIETRTTWTTSEVPWILEEHPEWAGLKSIAMVESIRKIGTKQSTERRYYISSLDSNAKTLAEAIRAHWSIENALHWVLDVSFREDFSRVRSHNAPQNLAVLRRVVLNLIRQEKSFNRGVPQKRLRAALDNAYLEKILTS